MKKIIGIIVIILMIPVIISIISDIDRTPVYPTTEFNIEKITRISSLDIENNIELPKLPNGVGDRWLSDGIVERNIARIVLNENLDWGLGSDREDSHSFIVILSNSLDVGVDTNLISNRIDFPIADAEYSLTANNYIYKFGKNLFVRINKNELTDWNDSLTSTEKINLFKTWLASNNIELLYQLETPTIENAPTLSEFIDFYDGGSVIVDDGIIDYTIVGNQAKINYIEGNITTVVDEQFIISKPTKIISKSNDLYNYDLSTLPNYLEYGTLPQGTYDNILEFISDNQNKDVKIYYNDIIQEHRFITYLENGIILLSNDIEFITIYEDDTYTSTLNLDTNITYKLEGYNIIDYIDGEYDNTVLAFFWIIPVLLAGGLIYLLLKRKE